MKVGDTGTNSTAGPGGSSIVGPDPTAESPEDNEVFERDLVLNPQYKFDRFVVGPSNQLAAAAARSVADVPGSAYNPLFLHGASGLGKTHLLQAICHRQLERDPGSRTIYLSSETFLNQFIQAIEFGELERFRFKYRSVDLLLIDDIHLMAHKERTQEEFFHTFNALYNGQKQVVLTSDCGPTEIPALRERLVSRFEWGLVAEISRPRYETRLAILRLKARDRGVEIPADVLAFLAERFDRNIRELEGAITKLVGYSQLASQDIDIDLAHRVVAPGGADSERLTSDADGSLTEGILSSVCQAFGVTKAGVLGRQRSAPIVKARQTYVYLLRQSTNFSLEEIGRMCGGRDHSTVLYAIGRAQNRMQSEPDYAEVVKQLQNSN